MCNLLVSHGLFAGLIAMVIIVVLLCIALAALLFFRPFKTKTSLDADTVKRELYRRETELVIKIVIEKAEGREKEDLLNELRRIRWVEALIDEIVRTEKTERGIVDKPKAPVKRPAAHKPAEGRKPVGAPQNVEAKEAKAETAAASSKEAAAKAKPKAKKKKDSLEFEPSED